MPVEIDPGLIGKRGRVADWRKRPLLTDILKHRGERELVEGSPEPTAKRKHAKIKKKRKARVPTVRGAKVRMKKTTLLPLSRLHSQVLIKGQVYEVPEHFARQYLKNGNAVEVKETNKGDEK